MTCLILQNTFVAIKMFLYSTVSFILNSIHFLSFLALFFLSVSKNVKDAACLLKHSFYADLHFKTCIKAVETQLLSSFYAGLHKSCRNTAFTQQVCVKAACKSFAKAGGIGTCVIAAFPQLLLIMTGFTKLCVKAVEKPAFLQLFCRVA